MLLCLDFVYKTHPRQEFTNTHIFTIETAIQTDCEEYDFNDILYRYFTLPVHPAYRFYTFYANYFVLCRFWNYFLLQTKKKLNKPILPCYFSNTQPHFYLEIMLLFGFSGHIFTRAFLFMFLLAFQCIFLTSLWMKVGSFYFNESKVQEECFKF